MPDIYHITHVKNITSILGQGGLYCDNTVSEKVLNPKTIAYVNLKSRRAVTPVPIGPKGTLSDYVPFYFAPRSPMLYVISRGGVPGYTDGQEQVVYLVSSTELIQQNNLPFVFTDGHASVAFSQFFDNLTNLNRVDWKIMRETYWRDTVKDGDRSRRRNAEFLVYQFVSWALIQEISVMSTQIARVIDTMIGAVNPRPNVVIRRNWYY